MDINHGHVRQNQDGSIAKCGGPAICTGCAAELMHHGMGVITTLRFEKKVLVDRIAALEKQLLEQNQSYGQNVLKDRL